MRKSIYFPGFLIPVVILSLMGTGCQKEDNPVTTDGPLTDNDGNEYTTVTIGDQEWMVENLRVTRLNDDTPVPEVTVPAEWSELNSPGFCWYNHDREANLDSYGALYNWHAVSTGKLCPAGWHVPSASEWEVLHDFLGDSAASKLKETGNTHWTSSNKDATNNTGFTALPGGLRDPDAGFRDHGAYGYWWTASLNPLDNTRSLAREMNKFSRDGSELVYSKNYGLSVRCIKN